MSKVLSILMILQTSALAKPLWVHQTSDDPTLALAVLAGTTTQPRPQLIAGRDSGTLISLSGGSSGSPEVNWTCKLDGSVLALHPMADINGDGLAEVVATTDVGMVACVSGGGTSAGKVLWSLQVTFNTSQLVVLPDTNGDGVGEVAFGGADHRVHLASGADGKELWSRFVNVPDGYTYVDCLADAGDLNGDGISDLFVRTWGAHRWALSGADGADIWSPRPGDPYLSTLVAAGDVNGDGVPDLLESGNDGELLLCSGRDGAEIWRSRLGRPIRVIAVARASAKGDKFECFAGTAEGKVACVTGATAATVKTRWTAMVGDVCRTLILLDDVNKDGSPEVAAGAENGVVAVFSGASGKELWKWQGADVVRTVVGVGDLDQDGISDIAVSLLDGSVVMLSGRVGAEPSSDAPAKADKSQAVQGEPERKRPAPAAQEVTEVPILLYHDVPPQRIRPAESDPLVNFREQMDLLVEAGYTAVSLEEIAEWIEGKRELPAKPVCITFDGQYASHDTHLCKILQDHGMFAVSYITTDWIGTANHLDWHELRRLERSGVVRIENHTFNHATLSMVAREEVLRQLSISNTAISQHLDGKISKHHAYPNGAYNRVARDAVAELGFRTATTVLHRRANRSDGVFQLPRYTIAEDMPLSTFKAIIGYTPLPYPSLAYKFVGNVGSGWRQPGYGDVDAEGKLWICDIGANNVRVFLPDGKEAPFSPISQGLKEKGESMPVRSPAGVAVTPGGELLISISSRYGSIRHSGLFRYRASDGKELPGIDLPYYPGDVDTDAKGMVYVVDKLTGQWHLYTPDGKEVPGSPFGRDAGLNVCRGITVTPDGSTVYVISETSANVRVWKGSATPASARYEQTRILAERLSSECGGVDVMDDGTVLVGYHDEGMVVAFDAQKRLLGQISGGPTPSLAAPRGTAFSPDGKIVWIIGRIGQVQRWEKTSAP